MNPSLEFDDSLTPQQHAVLAQFKTAARCAELEEGAAAGEEDDSTDPTLFGSSTPVALLTDESPV